MTDLKIKICGMREAKNLAEVAARQPDYLGFIFYPKSARYVGDDWDASIINQLPKSIERVGVFVNENIGFILSNCHKYSIKTVQLHGNENPRFCSQLQRKGYTVFKAFQVDDNTQLKEIEAYKGKCDYFLYDTKSKGLGGSGQKFNWAKLNELNAAGPFLLSGGITSKDAIDIKALNLSNLKGVDINSKFEITPALKDIKLLDEFINELRNN
jgi:phosphoribosylanthranilate isomerase